MPLIAAGAAAEPKQAPRVEAPIAFAAQRIWERQGVDTRTALMETTRCGELRPTLSRPCIDLSSSERIGFQSTLQGSVDKFSAIEALGARCPGVSLEAAAASDVKP